ncbi:Y-family DNA polymerase [Microbulbifer aggregans]|uniref:Y-family DNA polymerase n=1 Tax=Microbulbifer aggregans TaxID=1769779 RepID=UPI00299EDA8B|nr:Y-family DNA polymerase [Microbulbifer aggregans]
MKCWDLEPNQIALVDVNNFYVSSERAFDPTIRHKPVAVYSNNDGCVIARCAEVKAMGVKMGTPVFEVRKFFRERGVVPRSSNYELYHDMSCRFTASLEQFCPDVEQYSIDESFLHFRGFGEDLAAHCQRAVSAVHKWTSMPCCAGIAPTRTLAKACNHFAKTLGVSGGVLQLNSEYHRQQLLKQLPVGEVWGVGSRLAERFEALGIETAWDLSVSHMPTMRKAFGVTVERTMRELQGTPCIELAPLDQAKNEIVSGRMFGKLLTDFDALMASIANHVMLACEKLAAQKGVAGRLVVSLQGRVPGGEWREQSAYTALRPACDAPQVLMKAARACLREVFGCGREYRRASVMLTALEEASETQSDLFDASTGMEAGVADCLAAINHRFGRGKVVLGSVKLSDEWVMKRDFLSPAYTSDFSQLPSARV